VELKEDGNLIFKILEMNYLLKQSAIKVIIITIIIPIIIQFIIIDKILVYNYIKNLHYFLVFIFGLFYLPYLYWFYNSSKFLFSIKNEFFNLKFNTYKISFLYIILILFNFLVFFSYVFSFVLNEKGEPNLNILIILIIIQFTGIFAFIYSSYFISKLIATIELKRKVYFTEITKDMFNLAIPPLAIIYIQNKILKISKKRKLNKELI
jgi:hypothetical protein